MRKPSPGFDSLLKEIEEKESSEIHIEADFSVKGLIRDYKIYVNGNIRITPPRCMGKRTENVEIIPVEPGEYTVVVRERDVNKEGRLVSNTVNICVSEKHVIELKLSFESDRLNLTNENS